MPIVEMKKVSLFAHRNEKETVVRLLRELGLVQLANVQESPSWEEMAPYLVPDQADADVARLESKLGEVCYCLDFLQRYFPVRKNLAQQLTGSKITLTPDEYKELISKDGLAGNVHAYCRQADDSLTQLKNEMTRNENLLAELLPWLGFSLPLGQVAATNRVRMQLGAVPDENISRLRDNLEAKAPDHYLDVVNQDKNLVYCFLIYMADDADKVEEVLKDSGMSSVSFPGLSDTAAASYQSLQEKIAAQKKEQEAVKERIKELLTYRPFLMAYYDYLDGERSKKEVVSNFARTESSFLLEGWIPAGMLKQLETTMAAETETVTLIARDPGSEDNPPVFLQNSGLAEPCEAVTKLYSIPHPGEIDPTPLMAPFFYLFFGMCLSDAGYGFLLALMALYLKRKLKLGGMGKQLVDLLLYGGIVSVFFGALMGGYFGDLFGLKPLWFNPLDDPMTMLIYCMALGLLHIFFGMGVSAYRSIKAGHILDALFDQGLWYVFLIGLILLLVGINPAGKWLSIGGAVGLVLTQGRTQKGLLKKFFSGLISLYNVTGYLSDVLSYSRLLALGLATGVIATAINTMGGLLAKGIIGTIAMVILLIGGHVFNLLINTLGSYVHTSRLQYIEFFGKFFEGGGKLFRPFRTTTQYIEVEEREA